jgi:hypothetical protein
MSGLWFRVYDEALDDPRLQRLPASLFRAWFNMLCAASRNGGSLPDLSDLAFMLRMRPGALTRRLEALKVAGLIEEVDGVLRPVEWEKRQFVRQDAQDGGEPMTAAERTRRWRERRARDAGNVTAGDGRDVTVTPLEEETDLETEKQTQTAPARECVSDNFFSEFWSAFPSRDGDNPKEPARSAFQEAVAAGAEPKAIIVAAKAYASATAGRERRYVASAARWLGERRWQGGSQPTIATSSPAMTPAPGVWISATSPEWRAWADHWRATKSKTPPTDAKGGWRFPSRYPPEPQPMAA